MRKTKKDGVIFSIEDRQGKTKVRGVAKTDAIKVDHNG